MTLDEFERLVQALRNYWEDGFRLRQATFAISRIDGGGELSVKWDDGKWPMQGRSLDLSFPPGRLPG
jgi:hypothetical protein